MKTFMARKEDVTRKWYVIDATDKILGKIAVKAADVLRGKNKVQYTPHVDVGDFVIVINAEKVMLTGRKEEEKTYHRYSGYTGGLKEHTVKTVREKNPELIIYNAVKGMIPKNKLGRKIIKKLKVYRGSEHSHKAQTPEMLEL